jgi:hypothetical protein
MTQVRLPLFKGEKELGHGGGYRAIHKRTEREVS